MTTKIEITAHCADDKQVNVQLDTVGTTTEHILQSTETLTAYVHDDRVISVREELKEQSVT